MIKSLFSLFFLASLSLASEQTTSSTPTRTGDFPDVQMKMQKEDIVKLVATEITQTLPQIVDKYTTLASVVAKDTTLVYTFEINTGSKSDESIQKEDRSRMKKAVTTGVCQSSRKFLEAGINTSYLYVSAKSKVELFKFDISHSNCTGLVNR